MFIFAIRLNMITFLFYNHKRLQIMIRLNCFFKANEEKYNEALEAATLLTAASLKDEGCVAYDTFESATHSDIFMICETWKDEESLQKHMAAPHFKEYVGKLEQLGALKLEKFDFPAK